MARVHHDTKSLTALSNLWFPLHQISMMPLCEHYAIYIYTDIHKHTWTQQQGVLKSTEFPPHTHKDP